MAEDPRQAIIRDYILKDPFVRRLGATVEAIAPGYSRVSLEVTEEMVNFHGMTHGAVVFALSDIAFAAASSPSQATGQRQQVSCWYMPSMALSPLMPPTLGKPTTPTPPQSLMGESPFRAQLAVVSEVPYLCIPS